MTSTAATTPFGNESLRTFLQSQVDPAHLDLMLHLASYSLAPWWNMLHNGAIEDLEPTLNEFYWAMTINLPDNEVWSHGIEGKPPLVNLIGGVANTLALKHITRANIQLSEPDQRAIELACIDPLVIAFNYLYNGSKVATFVAGMVDVINRFSGK